MDTTNGEYQLQLYDPKWNYGNLWYMIGYPDDFVPLGTQVFQGPSAVQSIDETPYGLVYNWEGVIKSGDSGASVYGMFDGSPRLIGVAASYYTFSVNVHGGESMFLLIIRAKVEYP